MTFFKFSIGLGEKSTTPKCKITLCIYLILHVQKGNLVMSCDYDGINNILCEIVIVSFANKFQLDLKYFALWIKMSSQYTLKPLLWYLSVASNDPIFSNR